MSSIATAPSPVLQVETLPSAFQQRWSPRGFGADAISEREILALFEAARWAPSANNAQPWRFVYVLRSDAAWADWIAFLAERNQQWAASAAALVLVASKTTRLKDGDAQPSLQRTHAFDTGAAWMSLALEAWQNGWRTRAIGGFDQAGARREVALPDDHEAHAIIALGRPREDVPSPAARDRRPLSDWVWRGRF